jgi:hypothetical protein
MNRKIIEKFSKNILEQREKKIFNIYKNNNWRKFPVVDLDFFPINDLNWDETKNDKLKYKEKVDIVKFTQDELPDSLPKIGIYRLTKPLIEKIMENYDSSYY